MLISWHQSLTVLVSLNEYQCQNLIMGQKRVDPGRKCLLTSGEQFQTYMEDLLVINNIHELIKPYM